MSVPCQARAALCALALFVASCGSDPAGPPETQRLAISAESGSNQSGRATTTLPSPLKVRVLREGIPVPGVQVIWETDDGALEASGATNAFGFASAIWTLPPRGGAAYATARIEADEAASVQFRAESRAPALRKVSGDGQAVTVGGKVQEPLRVQATFDGEPLPGLSVHWSCLAAPVLTDDDGMSSATCGMGERAGAVVQEARIQGLEVPGVSFSLTATPGPLAVLRVPEVWFDTRYWTGSGGITMSVFALDAYGNGLEGVSVSWSFAIGAGSFEGGGTSDASGWASVVAKPADGYAGDLQLRAAAGTIEAVSSTFHYAHFMFSNPTGFGDYPFPAGVSVSPGTVVRWAHAGSESHLLGPAGGTASGRLDNFGDVFEQAFTTAGVHEWTCALHSWETFTVTVTP